MTRNKIAIKVVGRFRDPIKTLRSFQSSSPPSPSFPVGFSVVRFLSFIEESSFAIYFDSTVSSGAPVVNHSHRLTVKKWNTRERIATITLMKAAERWVRARPHSWQSFVVVIALSFARTNLSSDCARVWEMHRDKVKTAHLQLNEWHSVIESYGLHAEFAGSL